eukprot:13468358-Alexandrium_andersonii.AAC.1
MSQFARAHCRPGPLANPGGVTLAEPPPGVAESGNGTGSCPEADAGGRRGCPHPHGPRIPRGPPSPDR